MCKIQKGPCVLGRFLFCVLCVCVSCGFCSYGCFTNPDFQNSFGTLGDQYNGSRNRIRYSLGFVSFPTLCALVFVCVCVHVLFIQTTQHIGFNTIACYLSNLVIYLQQLLTRLLLVKIPPSLPFPASVHVPKLGE